MDNVTYYPRDNRIGFKRKARSAEFSAEASTLFGPDQVPTEFNLTVSASGNTKRFTSSHVTRDREGDIETFVYTAPGGFQFILFND